MLSLPYCLFDGLNIKQSLNRKLRPTKQDGIWWEGSLIKNHKTTTHAYYTEQTKVKSVLLHTVTGPVKAGWGDKTIQASKG